MKTAVIIFPGSNCDRDMITALTAISGQPPARVWHGDAQLPKVDLVALPGGFSYGDYLRSGAMAAHSPIMREVVAHATRGGLVLGVCNGFQILTEAGLLPGALMRNAKLNFVCRDVFLRVENTSTIFTKRYRAGQIVNIPVAHHDGFYFADDSTLDSLEQTNSILFRYCDAQGNVNADANPNGSLRNIAGIVNAQKNVLGMMPHPERHCELLTGGMDGRALFESLLAA